MSREIGSPTMRFSTVLDHSTRPVFLKMLICEIGSAIAPSCDPCSGNVSRLSNAKIGIGFLSSGADATLHELYLNLVVRSFASYWHHHVTGETTWDNPRCVRVLGMCVCDSVSSLPCKYQNARKEVCACVYVCACSSSVLPSLCLSF